MKLPFQSAGYGGTLIPAVSCKPFQMSIEELGAHFLLQFVGFLTDQDIDKHPDFSKLT
jgi:hypothetical protein